MGGVRTDLSAQRPQRPEQAQRTWDAREETGTAHLGRIRAPEPKLRGTNDWAGHSSGRRAGGARPRTGWTASAYARFVGTAGVGRLGEGIGCLRISCRCACTPRNRRCRSSSVCGCRAYRARPRSRRAQSRSATGGCPRSGLTRHWDDPRDICTSKQPLLDEPIRGPGVEFNVDGE